MIHLLNLAKDKKWFPIFWKKFNKISHCSTRHPHLLTYFGELHIGEGKCGNQTPMVTKQKIYLIIEAQKEQEWGLKYINRGL